MKHSQKKIEPDLEFIYGRVPPQDIVLERLVLGILLTDTTGINTVYQILKPKTFYATQHEVIYAEMQKMHGESETIEPMQIIIRLRKANTLDGVGGPFYITQLVNNAYQIAHLVPHALYLKELQFKRDLISVQTASIESLYNEDSDVFDALVKVQNATEGVISEIQSIQTKNFSDEVYDALSEMKEAATHGYKTGVPFMNNNLDGKTGGAQKGDLIILAARPSMGKSALMLDCARKQAKNGIPVGIVSIEMGTRSLVLRMISQETQIDLDLVGKGALKKSQWEHVDTQTLKLAEYPIFIEERGGIGILALMNKAKGWVIKHAIQILYVDYLQLAEDDSGESKSREQEVSNISRKLKKLAKELQIPVVALAQLSRQVESRADKRPLLADLRESGGIEQDADMVIFLYRESYYNRNSNDHTTEAIVAKFRNGTTGTALLEFNGAHQTFEDASFQ